MTRNFSAYPFDRLRKLSRREAALESAVARWLAVRPAHGERLAKLLGGAFRVERVAVASPTSARAFDPFAARCEVRVAGAAFDVRGASRAVRTIAQRLLGGPEELAAPRPLGVVERSIWALVVATAVEDLGLLAEVWPVLADFAEDDVGDDSGEPTRIEYGRARAKPSPTQPVMIDVALALADLAVAVQLRVPSDFELRVPPARDVPAWFASALIECPIVVGRCALARRDLDRLAVRTVVTLDRPAGPAAELQVLGGVVGLRASPAGLEAEVTTGYVARDMSLPDDAHVELTVALGTTQLSLRQLSELAVGQIVALGRPLAGPFELRAVGRVLGRGELVDVDGELAVRIVSLGD